MKKDDTVFLKHILESIEWIEKDTKGLAESQFLQNVPIQDAVLRRLEINRLKAYFNSRIKPKTMR